MRENIYEMYRRVFPRVGRITQLTEEPECPSWVRQWMRGKGMDMTLEEGIERVDMELSVLRVDLEQWIIAKCMIEDQIDKQKLKIIEKESQLGVLRREKERR